MKKPLLVVSTGAGMSAESGISTFRDSGGLWENYPVMQVASADGFRADPALIHRFYNAHRIKGEAPELAGARLKLADVTRSVLANGLGLIGVSAPEKM